MKRTIFSLITIAVLSSCSFLGNKTVIKGELPNDYNGEVRIQIDEFDLDTTIQVNSGKFTYDLETNNVIAGFISGKTFASQFVADGSELILKKVEDKIKLVSSDENSLTTRLQSYTSKNSDLYYIFNDIKAKVEKDLTLSDEEKMAKLLAKRDSLATVGVEFFKKEMKENVDNFLSIGAYKYIGGNLSTEETEEFLKTLSDRVSKTKFIVAIKNRLEAKKKTAVGSMFLDFTVVQDPANPETSTVKLSDYVGKGKYILVDFWASWCGPCRGEMPHIKKVYDKYKGDKFDVVSVACWDKVEDSKSAIKDLDMTWNQILNAQKVASELYAIEGIPHIILFSPEGKILKRGLRGDDIEKAVKDALQ